MSISCWKKQTIPGRTEAQIQAAKPKCAALYKKYRLKNWILDDESYFTLGHSSINGNSNKWQCDQPVYLSGWMFEQEIAFFHQTVPFRRQLRVLARPS